MGTIRFSIPGRPERSIRASRVPGLLALLILSLCVLGLPAVATERLTGDEIIVPQNRTIDDDLVAAGGGTIRIEGRVVGDVMAAGSEFTHSGRIGGSLMAVGGSIAVDGPVGNGVRAAGGTVMVNAPIPGNVMLAGESVDVGRAATIGRDADIAASLFHLEGQIGRNLELTAKDAVIRGAVRGTVRACVEQIELQAGAVVYGDLIVYGPHPPTISPEAKVHGRVEYHPTEPEPAKRSGPWSWILARLTHFLSLLVLGSVILALFRPLAERVGDVMRQRLPAALAVGLGALTLTLPVCLLAGITVVGLPLSLTVFAVWCIALLLAGVWVSYVVGGEVLRRLGREQTSPYAALALGAGIVAITSALPWIGWPVEVVVLCVGVGALLLSRPQLQ